MIGFFLGRGREVVVATKFLSGVYCRQMQAHSRFERGLPQMIRLWVDDITSLGRLGTSSLASAERGMSCNAALPVERVDIVASQEVREGPVGVAGYLVSPSKVFRLEEASTG